MNFDEKHSHKWSRVFRQAKDLAESAASAFAADNLETARRQLRLLYEGDLNNRDNPFPGLKLMAPYWKGVEDEMQLRFEHLTRHPDAERLIKQNAFADNAALCYRLLKDDVRQLLAEKKLFNYQLAAEFCDTPEKLYLGADWIESLNRLKTETQSAIESGALPPDLLNRWFIYCLRGVMSSTYGLIKQAVFSALVIKNYGEERLIDLISGSREDFGWAISKMIFVSTFPRAGFSPQELKTLGFMGMMCDQDVERYEKKPAPNEEGPTIRGTIFLTCQEYSAFKTVGERMGVPPIKMGSAICTYCAEHAEKCALVCTPPHLHPECLMQETLALGKSRCVFEFRLHVQDDMERFMRAQDMLADNP